MGIKNSAKANRPMIFLHLKVPVIIGVLAGYVGPGWVSARVLTRVSYALTGNGQQKKSSYTLLGWALLLLYTCNALT